MQFLSYRNIVPSSQLAVASNKKIASREPGTGNRKLPFRNFIVAYSALAGTFKAVYIINADGGMLGFSALHTFAPHAPR
jgi:hypothetical protein